MKSRHLLVLTAVFVIAGVGLGLLLSIASAASTGTVSGVVLNSQGPLSGAIVRVRATDNYTITPLDGQFTLGSLIEGREVEVTAWATGYYVASARVTPTISGVSLTLRPYHTTDHPGYAWISPITGTSDSACGNCHPMILPQWMKNAHGGAISNLRFFSLYNGSDISGTVQAGPGYLNDFPGTAGNCANCHAPGVGVDGYLTTHMNAVRDVITAGIHCDYCHKVGGVYLNPATQSVYPNAPGARSQNLLRPPDGDNIFFGPFDDIPDPDTFLPAIRESQFCAPCHQFSMWGTPIYESYEEWLASDYAEAGITCQDCHMPPNGDVLFALPNVGGLEHPPDQIPSHLQLGASDVGFLQDTVNMSVTSSQLGDLVQVTVMITNTAAGHHVPTDFPGRHMILTVTVMDDQGQNLPLLSGATVPLWGGMQSGSPGKAFAKVLKDTKTGEWPVVSYWKQTTIDLDNRIPALGTDISTYTFVLPGDGGELQVSARLIFRRVFQDLAEQKGWGVPDILMAEHNSTLEVHPAIKLFLPLIGMEITDE